VIIAVKTPAPYSSVCKTIATKLFDDDDDDDDDDEFRDQLVSGKYISNPLSKPAFSLLSHLTKLMPFHSKHSPQ
jgi:hypothetical protein